MREVARAGAVFALAAGINTANVAVEQQTRSFTRFIGSRGWYLHLALVLPVWAGFLLQLARVGRRVRWPLPRAARPVGTLLLLCAGSVWLTAYRQLGPVRTGNGNVFGHGSRDPVTGGMFRYRANPMYDSYVLALVGLALRAQNAVYLLLAGEALVLFHGLEAPIENRQLAARAPAPRSLAAPSAARALRAAVDRLR